MTEPTTILRTTVNGRPVERIVPVRLNLVDFLRDELHLTGSHVGCEHGVCGACTLCVDGEIVRGCLMLAVQAEGRQIETIEGLAATGAIAELQASFLERNALQCGFCTPAMLLTADALLNEDAAPSREAIRVFMSGNYCRCTGYHAILDAIADAATRRRARREADG